MNFRTLIQAGPVRANELLGKLAETSDAAVKNRDKLFTELKTELEKHLQMEQDHLLPILLRNAETKDLAAETVKDNRELRAKLAELQGAPKNDAAFPGRVAELRKAFRQHARNDRKELLPVVQQALKTDVSLGANHGAGQPVAAPAAATDKIEQSLAAAARSKQDEVERREAQAATAREQAEHAAEERKAAEHKAAEQRAETERARQVEVQAQAAAVRLQAEQAQAAQEQAKLQAERDRQATLAANQEKVRQQLELAEREAAAERVRTAVQRPVAEATAAETNGLRQVAGSVANGATRMGANLRGAGEAYAETVRRATPDLRAIGVLPGLAANGMTELGSTWLGFFSQAAVANARLTQELAERQRQFAMTTWQGLMEANAKAIHTTFRVAQQSLNLTAAAPNRDASELTRSSTAQASTAQASTAQSPAARSATVRLGATQAASRLG